MYRLISIVFIVVSTSFCPQSLNTPDGQVMKAAEGQMDVFLEKIQPGEQANYGFTNEDDLDLCTVGKPYRILEFKRTFFNSKQLIAGTDYLEIKNEWRAPVINKGVHRVLLTVTGNPGNYSVTGMADPGLARELQQKTKGIGEKEEFYILRIYPLLAEFFVHESNNSFMDAQFIPLESAIKVIPELTVSKKASYTLSETEQMVKDALTHTVKEPSTPAEKKVTPKKKTLK